MKSLINKLFERVEKGKSFHGMQILTREEEYMVT